MMLLLIDSALRSLLFGFLVWALLKLLRIRDTGTETITWTAVLIVALSMPLLNRCLPSSVLTVPQIWPSQPTSLVALSVAGADDASLKLSWLARHGQTCLLGVYVLGLMICLTRLSIGLLQSVRLYWRAVPVEANWAKTHHIRVSAILKSPASLAGVILVPPDYCTWSAVKREAVLAHEGAHIARGDFFVQLAASFHCAFFWFSPFAWWLRSKLADTAESASDDAAIQRLNDRVTYAEILLEVASRAQQSPLIIAMAEGPSIEERVERILSEERSQNPSTILRTLIIGSLPFMAFALATAEAAIAPSYSIALSENAMPAVAKVQASAAPRLSTVSHSAPAIHKRSTRRKLHVPQPPSVVQRKGDQVSYNPRALLEPSYPPVRPYVPPSTIVTAGKTFYILSTERPVTENSDAYGTYRE